MRFVTLDLETVQPLWEPPEDKPDRFPGLLFHRPICLTWLQVDIMRGENPDDLEPSFELQCHVCEDLLENEFSVVEQTALAALAEALVPAKRVITFNGRRFDMPLLNARAMMYEIRWAFWLAKRHRFGRYNDPLVHYDLLDQIGDSSGINFSLDKLCELLGLPGKYDVHGSDVGKLCAAGKFDDVARYCGEDVLQTWLAYLRWSMSFGGNDILARLLSERTYLWAKGEPMFETLLARMNR